MRKEFRESIAAALEKSTGLKFKTAVPTNYAAVIEAMGSDEGEMILDLAARFRWSKPGSAALAAGWAALAPVCGALRWRPHIWLAGGPGSGKSTVLNDFLFFLTGGLALFEIYVPAAAADSTAFSVSRRIWRRGGVSVGASMHGILRGCTPNWGAVDETVAASLTIGSAASAERSCSSSSGRFARAWMPAAIE